MSAPLRKAAWHRLLWRVHFWAGWVGAPLILFVTLTGLLYVFAPALDAWRHSALDRVPAIGAARLPLDAQVAAARAASPEAPLRYVVPARRPEDSTQVYFQAAGGARPAHAGHDHGIPTGHVVYVDPYTGQVLGRLAEMQRLKTWLNKLHASALQGEGGRWLSELAASWTLVLLITGLALWWPRSRARGGPGWRALLPRLGAGRRSWRALHASVSVSLGLVLMLVLVTGLVWSRHAGANFRALQERLGQAAPKPPAALASGAAGTAGPLGWQAILDLARGSAAAPALRITPPERAGSPWRIDEFDRGRPTERTTRLVDARSGAVLHRSGWPDQPLLAKAIALGIPFHRGDLGLWNQ